MIAETIENLGIQDIPSYNQYKEKLRGQNLPQEEIQQLSPDTINSKEFWKYIDENPKLRKDAICFGAEPATSLKAINKINKEIELLSGVSLYFNYWCSKNIAFKVLEIGPGFGAFKHKADKNKRISYWGVDCWPKIKGVLELEDGDTKLPESIRTQQFEMVFSSNVFQHLSFRQRDLYYRQIKEILTLTPEGVFSFNTFARFYNEKVGFTSDDKQYLCHYGQFTEIQTVEQLMIELSAHFSIINFHCMPYSQLVTFHCTRKRNP